MVAEEDLDDQRCAAKKPRKRLAISVEGLPTFLVWLPSTFVVKNKTYSSILGFTLSLAIGKFFRQLKDSKSCFPPSFAIAKTIHLHKCTGLFCILPPTEWPSLFINTFIQTPKGVNFIQENVGV